MKCPAIELLTEIRDLLAANGELAHKRAVKAAQQARYRMRKRSAEAMSEPCPSGEARTPPLRRCDVSPHHHGGLEIASVDTTPNVDTTKEEEKGKETFPPAPPIENKGKEEEKAPLGGCAREDERDGLFAQFWSAYPGPRKRCKPKCRDKFFAFLADPATRQANFARLMAGLDRWKRHDTWMRDGGRYIQAPLVWLNDEDWDAEIAVGPLVAPSERLDPKAAAFERQRAEAEERRRYAEAVAATLLERHNHPVTGGARDCGSRGARALPPANSQLSTLNSQLSS